MGGGGGGGGLGKWVAKMIRCHKNYILICICFLAN